MSDQANIPAIPRKFLFSFILVTILFALWGFANDITNPLVAAFKDIFVINNAQSSWVQMAFYGGLWHHGHPGCTFYTALLLSAYWALGFVVASRSPHANWIPAR